MLTVDNESGRELKALLESPRIKTAQAICKALNLCETHLRGLARALHGHDLTLLQDDMADVLALLERAEKQLQQASANLRRADSQAHKVMRRRRSSELKPARVGNI